MKNVLILRPFSTAFELAEQVRSLKVSVVLEPLFKIHHLSLPPLDYRDVQALIVTSQNAIHSLKYFPLKSLPLYTVGDKTAIMGEKIGFNNVISAGGTVRDLKELLKKQPLSPNKKIIYFAGDVIKEDITETLNQQGLWTEKIICYCTEAALKLSDNLQNQLKQNEIEAVMFLSRRNVELFTRLIHNLEVHSLQKNIRCLCLSQSIAKVAEAYGWKKTWFCSNPSIPSLLRYFS